MKKKGNCAFTLVELIAVVAILSILLCIAVPNMMNYINAAMRQPHRQRPGFARTRSSVI